MTHWIRRLAQHYEAIRRRAPNTKLALVFDIDGTILDMAPAARALLRRHGEASGRDYLGSARGIDIARADWSSIVTSAGLVGTAHRCAVAELAREWNRPDTALATHRPFRGVLELIRWFQLQPNTEVALNTARPESQRLDTLRLLNILGHEYRVRFSSDLLFMRESPGADAPAAKVRGIATLRARGYRVVAAIDNEPAYLRAISADAPDNELLTFNARNIHAARREAPYDLRELLGSRRLPRHVQFVWQDIRGEGELQRFLTSSIHWGEVALSGFRDGEPLVGDVGLPLHRVISAMLQRARRCKINLVTPEHADGLLPWLARNGYPPEALWFDVPRGPARKETLRRLAEIAPGSVRQCTIDELVCPDGDGLDTTALEDLSRTGATRFSLDWLTPGKSAVLDALDARGHELHLHSIPDMDSFLRASLLLPCSVGTTFDFPQLAHAARRRAV